MCVLAFAWRASADWPLVLIGNRDEFHARPAAPLERWDDRPHLLAGRDLQSGGTWLGVSDAGRLSVITNRRSGAGPDPALKSRGALVTGALDGALPTGNLSNYNPFSLIAVLDGRAHYVRNYPDTAHQALDPGLYGLSNGALDEPWPKTLRIKAVLADWLAGGGGSLTPLLDALHSDDSPQVAPGLAEQSPIFIRNPVYGTRCSTVVAIDRTGQGSIAERRFDSDGEALGQSRIAFRWL